MLFNSYEFILAFLPTTLLGFHAIMAHGNHRAAVAWLVAASLFFYGWWNPLYLGLIVASVCLNFLWSLGLVRSADGRRPSLSRVKLGFGVAANLLALAYFKYAVFFADNVSKFWSTGYRVQDIVLPLAISFFTFQQVAYLVDVYKGEIRESSFLNYCLFVLFFPQLIAGPIVHHREMLPQFGNRISFRLSSDNLSVGITIFIIGLFKKVVIADSMALYATPVFTAAESAIDLDFAGSWCGALSYTFQIYFDFSGYSDMAIGLARMFGVRLPINFHAPYRAHNIIEFWKRWHITLSRFLRDYLYIPLGGNQKGSSRRYLNLITTMLIGGLWHGAGWTFVAWGALHGVLLALNHAWLSARRFLGKGENTRHPLGRFASQIFTFWLVSVAWVLFRADSFAGAVAMLKGMAGLNGITLPLHYLVKLDQFFGLGSALESAGFRFEGGLVYFQGSSQALGLLILFIVVMCFPTTQEIMDRYRPALETYKSDERVSRLLSFLKWEVCVSHAVITAVVAAYTIMNLSNASEFIYFRF